MLRRSPWKQPDTIVGPDDHRGPVAARAGRRRPHRPARSRTRRGRGARWWRSRPPGRRGWGASARRAPSMSGSSSRTYPSTSSSSGAAALSRRHRGGDQPHPPGGRAGRRHPPHRLPGPRHRQRPAAADRRARHRRGARPGVRHRRPGRTSTTSGRPGTRSPPRRRPADTLYLLLFTSGSTGAPKAVRVSQGRLADAGQTMAKGAGFRPTTSCTAPCPCSTATPSTPAWCRPWPPEPAWCCAGGSRPPASSPTSVATA